MGVGVDLKLGYRRRDLGFVVEMAGRFECNGAGELRCWGSCQVIATEVTCRSLVMHLGL